MTQGPVLVRLEGDVGLAGPVGVDGDASDGGAAGGGASEEGAGEPGDLVLLHGDIEGALGIDAARGVEGCDREVDGALGVVEEGVEVELLLRGRDIELHVLLAVDTTEAGLGIESARATGVVELELLDVGGDVIVGQHETTEGRDTVEGDLVVDLLLTDGDIGTTEVGVGIARAVGELDLRGVGHRGVATGAMAHDHEEVVALSELEGGLAEIGCGRGLVDLLDARAAFIVDGEVEAGAGLGGRFCSPSGCCTASEVFKGGMLDFEDRDGEVGVFVSGRTAERTIIKDGLLAGGEEKEECA